jgi:signal peptidase I
MAETGTEKREKQKEAGKDRVEEVANTLEWLLTAFILAFVFRAFVMEPFRIPTGSMADTLMGAHFRLRCRQCGYSYEYGFVPERYRLPKDQVPQGLVKMPETRCPSCGYIDSSNEGEIVSNGDRILVLKSIYQFSEPRRWDVVVFKNPLDPRINFIKRMIGKPGETVEIIDGDIYINGQIERKPAKVQEEMWMPVYVNDYRPVRPEESEFNGHTWREPFITAGTKWVNDAVNPAFFYLDSPVGQINALVYDTKTGNDFRTAYAYNDVEDYKYMPVCSDLMTSIYVLSADGEGGAGIAMSKYQTDYRAWVDFKGKMTIFKIAGGKETELISREITPVLSGVSAGVSLNKPTRVRFANVDHQLIFEFGKGKLTYDLGRGPVSSVERKTENQPRVEILGSGRLTISHVSIFRDTYYTSRYANGTRTVRAGEGNQLVLKPDQFFVLGDNSPNSEDGRWWNRKGVGNNGKEYDEGIVPRDYLVGKAVFVYWPGGFRPKLGQNNFPFAIIPNIGQMRFIYGGRDGNGDK